MTPEENRRLYGKCNNPYGHGHDYRLEVSVEGPVDSNGQIVDRLALDDFVERRIIDRMNHRNLNVDVPELDGGVPTTENLAAAIRRMLEPEWDLPARLTRIRVAETDRNIFELNCS